MKALDRRLWAKEEVADAVISFLRDKLEHDQGLDADDRAELELQARRAARFLRHGAQTGPRHTASR